MHPAKIKGLNRDSSDESNDEEIENPLTKEALEQRTQQCYRDALILQKQNKLDEAEKLLRKLLQSDVLGQTTGKVKFINGRLQPSLFHLKYCCYLNLGNILFKSHNHFGALENYLKATELDDTDLNLWYKIGTVAMKIPNLTFAICAFTETLRRNVRHWPSLDAIITATYVTGDLMACLLFISYSLKLDSSYVKGIILKEFIFDKHPFLKNDFQIFHPECYLNIENLVNVEKEKDEMVFEINKFKHYGFSLEKKSENVNGGICLLDEWSTELKSHTWVCLGRFLLKLYEYLVSHADNELFFKSVKLMGFSEEASHYNELQTEIDVIMSMPNKVCANDETTVKVFGESADELNEDEDDIMTELISASAKHNELDKETVDGGIKPKRRKFSPTLADQLKSCDKRRSTRNKTALKNNEPSLSKTLQQLITQDLLPEKDKLSKSNFYDLIRWNDDSFDTMDIYRLLFEHQEQNNLPSYPVNHLSEVTRHKVLRDEDYFGAEKEKNDIEWFVRINNEQMILESIEAYLKELASKWRYTWPLKLGDLFVEMYRILLKHGFLNSRLKVNEFSTNEESLENLEGKFNVAIMYGELRLNQYLESEDDGQPLVNCAMGGDFFSLLIGDLHDACSLLSSARKSILPWMRTYWLEALIFLQKKDTFAACSALSTLIEEIPASSEVKLPNMKQFHIISLSNAKRLLNTLSRNQSLSEVKPLLLEKHYERVIEILQETLKPDCKQLMHLPNETTLSRYEQYNLLLAALWESRNYEKLFEWCEICLYEAFAIYRKSFFDEIETEAKAKWASLVTDTSNCMFSCLKSVGPSIVRVLKPECLSRLVQTLSNLVCHQIEANEPSAEIITDVVTPWILLSNLIEINEKEHAGEVLVENTGEIVLSPSLSLLFVAHEHLGRRSWCCFNDGALLFYTLNVIEASYKNCAAWSETWTAVSQQIDQIFYCLYSHPFKKNKPRHVVDHNSLGLALTWNRAVQAYLFYRPAVLPMFDAVSKFHTISGDTETLLKRMIPLVPEDRHPVRFVESVHRYLKGTIDSVPENDTPLPHQVIDLFYLLGDYYFKNKIMDKAIKYYLLDICSNPRRVDSWSAMALARGSQLETKLNSCETISSECDILKKAELIDKCYKTALELDFNQSTLWIEYGVYSYSIHAFCSRLLKQETTNLSLQMFDMLENQKEKFLKTAYHCFNSANKAWLALTSKQEDVQDERWLHHYMLGKIGEKREEKIESCLNHYYEASKWLNQNGAEYPTRILYSSPQYYSVEALEIHYRVHASILKTLLVHEEKPLDGATVDAFEMYIGKMAVSPFMMARTKSMPVRPVEKSTKDETTWKKTAATCSAVSNELREIVDEIIAKVVSETNDPVRACKRPTTDSCLSSSSSSSPSSSVAAAVAAATAQGVPAAKKFKSDSATAEKCAPVEQNDPRSDKIDEFRLTASSSTDEEEYGGKKKTADSRNELSDPKSPFQDESSSDSSSADSSSVASHFANDFEKEIENKVVENDIAIENQQKWQKKRKRLVAACISALEECVRRFPEHYKSFYRLSNHYFRSKLDEDIEKARKLLIEEGGLFADRTSKNFFGGIWRIPTAEIDRPGSFAIHMSRSIHLLMDVLRDTRDYKTLLQLSNQLRYKPDLDKKYLRDNEREQLCKDALSLSIQALRKHVDHMSAAEKEPVKRKLLVDVYKHYLRVSKNYSQKDVPFARLLGAVYAKYTTRKEKVTLEEILTFCKTVDQIAKSEPPETASTLLAAAIDVEINKIVPTSVPSIVANAVTVPSDYKSPVSIVSYVADPKPPPHPQPHHPKAYPTNVATAAAAAAIPPNLKSLQPAITVTTVLPQSPLPPPSQLPKMRPTVQPASSGGANRPEPRPETATAEWAVKGRQCVIIRTGAAFKERAKAKRILCASNSAAAKSTSATAPVRDPSYTATNHPLTANPKSLNPVATVDGGERSAITGSMRVKGKVAVAAATPPYAMPSLPPATVAARPPKTATSKCLPLTDSRLASREWAGLVITPVPSKGPTLQHKLAAKQMAANTSTAKVGGAGAATAPAHISLNAIQISKQLGSSGVTIFPLPADSSSHGPPPPPPPPMLSANRYESCENEILSHFQSNHLSSASSSSASASLSPSPSSSVVSSSASSSSASSSPPSGSSSPSPSPAQLLPSSTPQTKLHKANSAKTYEHVDFDNRKHSSIAATHKHELPGGNVTSAATQSDDPSSSNPTSNKPCVEVISLD